tara:strand:- start:4976 stop:5554 length:579 start_codon:yes stop_codon:yes gene_type:complete
MRRKTWRKAANCPAIIFNNSGSMAAAGRVQKSFDIIRDIGMHREPSFDMYVNDARTGIPDFIAHIQDISHGALNPPLLPLVTGEDYMNPLALAAIIQEYPSVHMIDDGDSITHWVVEALEILDSMGFDDNTKITLYYVRPHTEMRSVDRHYEQLKKMYPQGFDGTGNTEIMMYHAIPDVIDRRMRQPDRWLE